jgi:hypothetical protein
MTNVVTEPSRNSTIYFAIGCGKLLVKMVLQIVPMLSMNLKAATPIPVLCAVTLFSNTSTAFGTALEISKRQRVLPSPASQLRRLDVH